MSIIVASIIVSAVTAKIVATYYFKKADGYAIDQSKRDRKPEELPAVFHRKNHCEWLVTMPLDDWMKIYREWEAGYGLREDQQEDS